MYFVVFIILFVGRPTLFLVFALAFDACTYGKRVQNYNIYQTKKDITTISLTICPRARKMAKIIVTLIFSLPFCADKIRQFAKFTFQKHKTNKEQFDKVVNLYQVYAIMHKSPFLASRRSASFVGGDDCQDTKFRENQKIAVEMPRGT